MKYFFYGNQNYTLLKLVFSDEAETGFKYYPRTPEIRTYVEG